MEPGKRGHEAALLIGKMKAARARLNKAEQELTSVLQQLADLPAGLKTGVMRAIETAFDEVKQAELHVVEMDEIVRGQEPPPSTTSSNR